ncbi:MauE/DoxX family redox-associated membrane protein [Pedobacter sp. R-06]|uniref:MauE/DoxX family redox-associated membrane protein n=1 Tax=Pedobacter sp. R-06 TaxID=3404051 RepID=UPI003CF968CC
MGIKLSQNIYRTGYILLILLWGTTAASKLGDLKGFQADLDKQVFTVAFTSFLLFAVPVSELIAALLLAFVKSRLIGLFLSLILIASFTIYIILILAGYFNKVPCSCGGVLKLLGWKMHLLFNLFFTAITLLTIYIHLKREVGDKE